MRRFLLAFFFLFSLKNSNSQVILNEMYTSPKPGFSEFFELYNTNTGDPVDLDCYALIVYYDDGAGKKGFYVLDFPKMPIGPLSFFVGAATGPSFNVQQCSSVGPNFNWKEANGRNDASIKNYEMKADRSGYTMTDLPDIEDFLTANKNSQTGGFIYGIFLFADGVYINGFLGGHNSILVPESISGIPPLGMPALKYASNCGEKTIDWTTIKKAENVTENTGTDKNADNGFMRERDGKCGEWVKASSPTRDTNGNCTDDNHEHTPGKSNNGRSPVNDGFSLTTQTSVCGNRIDYAITGIRDRGNLKAPDMFPFIVELYKDVNGNGELDAGDLHLGTSSPITGVSENYFEFPGLGDPDVKYLLVFQSQNLNCLEKIIATDNLSLVTTEANFCGSEIDFTVNQSNFNVGVNSGFTASIYWDKGTIGKYEPALDQPFPGMTTYQFPGVKLAETKTFNIPDGYENEPYIIVYSPIKSSVLCEPVTRSGLTPVTTTFQTAQIYTCGDVNGDILTFNLQSVSGNTSGAAPYEVEIWADDNGNGILDLPESPVNDVNTYEDRIVETLSNVSLNKTYQQLVSEGGIPLIVVYKTARGCRATERLLQECAPLPINLGSFTAIRNKLKVLLKWETLAEQSNRGFYVQRNTKGVWENRAFVFSAADGGNSTEPLEYSFNDDNNEKGVSQYRIQQVDLDGKVTYTPIRSVRGEGQATRTIIYPNPSGEGKVNVVFEDEGSRNVIVSDINGRIIRQHRNVVNSLIIDNLDAGMYLLQITDLSTAETSVEKVIIKKR